MASDTEVDCVVIDCGSAFCRAGFASGDSPRAVFPPIVGRPKHQSLIIGMSQKDAYIGDEASTRRRGILIWKCPIEKRIVTGSWDDMEKILYHTFYNELRVDPQEHPTLMSESPFNPKSNKEKMTQIMFETFEVPAFYMANQGVLGLIDSGKSSGIVLDCGEGVCQSVPIYEGMALPHATMELDFAGRDVSAWLMSFLMDKGYSLYNTTAEKEIVRDIKEKLGRVVLNFSEEVNSPTTKEEEYEMPDGNIFKIGKESFKITEPFFTPTLLNMESYSLQEMIFQSISKCDLDLKKEMYNNIVLAGGSTLFKGFHERLSKELNEIIPTMVHSNISAPPHRKYSTFIGGTILGRLLSSQIVVLLLGLSSEYKEYGSSLIHRKCF
ncbi:hypothetical protein NAEGRDRAFT_29087 [Naegleria gruberi]|uniref:Actin n=1 Tax=Naegleria gruberi TaxID=5762 RepID=D2UYR7_NAEGR|nr:uncharacterized protein NAEGRDRAFT_29087 [Naegleria gruberi]EFC50526.1 hypothetical protein NAEGRDRAFT_29087 [Naegleria gruberi]|eukprot:XP_002683270.1 hypothetical protein NAEGRDRAFT_29087 [Naegleria gruberi strain NEG-M]